MTLADPATGVFEDPLSDAEYADLEKLETRISKGLETFVDVGNALAEIRDRKLYRQYHASFAAYCETQWDMGKSHAYRLIDAAEVVTDLQTSPIGDAPLPASESQARALKPLSGQPEKQAEAMREASKDGPATAAKIEEAVEKIVDPDLIARQQKEADRQRRVAEKAERDAAEKAAEAAATELHREARKRYPDVEKASIAREMSALFDQAADLLSYDPTETASFCNDLETDVRVVQARALVDWLNTHLSALENPGATVTTLRSAQ